MQPHETVNAEHSWSRNNELFRVNRSYYRVFLISELYYRIISCYCITPLFHIVVTLQHLVEMIPRLTVQLYNSTYVPQNTSV